MSHVRWSALAAPILIAGLLSVSGAAAGAPRDQARSFAESAAVLGGEGKYDAAADLFQKAYDLDPQPILLYNIARMQQKKGDLTRARSLYERYLMDETDAAGLERGRARLGEILEKLPGRLVVVPDPAGARVEIDGRVVAGGAVELKRGAHEVLVRLDGYGPEKRVAEVRAGEERRLDVKLTPVGGRLAMECDCPGGRVFVDGKGVGTFPLAGPLELASGVHDVEVLAAGHERFTRTVELRPGATTDLQVVLARLPEPVVAPAPRAAPPPPSLPPPLAESKEDKLRADLLQEASEKFLMLRGAPPDNSTEMPDDVFSWLLGAIEQLRFDVRDWAPTAAQTTAFCKQGAADAAFKAGEFADKPDEGRLTMERVLKRCSEVGQEWFVARHSCAWNNSKAEWDCAVALRVTIRKLKARAKADGTFDLVVDGDFGDRGTRIISSSGSGSDRDQHKALMSAAAFTRLWAERDVRDVEMFQLRAPIDSSDGDSSRFCLGRDAVELDTPFYVLKPTATGTERAGFVKARQIYDGCSMTSELKAKEARGEKFVQLPLVAQNILGRKEIQPGMTAWEMPSVGLNFGGGFATSPYGAAGNLGGTLAKYGFVPAAAIVVEYDLARHTGVSELWIATEWRFTVINALGGGDTKYFGIQADFGLFKRWYLMGPLFADLGAAASLSYAPQINGKYPYAVGGLGKLGLGLQLAGRWLARVNAGFRYAYNVVTQTAFDAEAGALLGLDVLYSY